MGTVIAIANQKGGVGKTTSAVSLSADLAKQGKRVLLIDFDPQGSASSGLGVEAQQQGQDLFDMFFQSVSLSKIIKRSSIDGLFVAPSSQDLVGIEIELGKAPGRELILKSELKSIKDGFDFIFIDCPPSSGLLTLNALGSADSILVPLQAEYYALEGLSALMQTVEFVCQTFNRDLKLLGVFITMFDPRTNLSIQVEEEAKKHFGEKMFLTRVLRNIRLSEAPSHGQPICVYDPASAGAKAYHALALEIDERCKGSGVLKRSSVDKDGQQAANE